MEEYHRGVSLCFSARYPVTDGLQSRTALRYRAHRPCREVYSVEGFLYVSD